MLAYDLTSPRLNAVNLFRQHFSFIFFGVFLTLVMGPVECVERVGVQGDHDCEMRLQRFASSVRLVPEVHKLVRGLDKTCRASR